MSDVGTHEGLTHRKRLRGHETHDATAAADHELEQLIVELYSDAKGWAPYKPQLRNLTSAAWWLSGVLAHEPGDVFHRSWPQIIRAIGRPLGWDVSGDIRELKDAHGPRTKRILGYLQVMGLIEHWWPIVDGRGESSGIDIEITSAARSLLHRQIALLLRSSSVQRRRGGVRRPAQKAREMVPPSGESRRVRQNSDCSLRDKPEKAVPAPHALGEGSPATAVQRPSVDANRPDGTASDGAALHRLRTAAGRAVAQAAPDLRSRLDAIHSEMEKASAAGFASHTIAIAAWEAMRRETGYSLDIRVHPKRWGEGIRGLAVADRYGAFDLPWAPGRIRPGIQWLLLQMLDSAMWGWQPMEITSRHLDLEPALNRRARGTVVSLSHFLCAVGQVGREWRRHSRARAGYNGQRKGRRQGTKRARRRRGRSC